MIAATAARSRPPLSKRRRLRRRSTPAFDREVEARFGASLAAIADADAAAAAAWAEGASDDHVLAHVLLWDQISRHCARVPGAATPPPADVGPPAVAVAREAVDRAAAWPAERQAFLLMPLRHTFDAAVLEGEVLPRARAWAAGGGAGSEKTWRRFEAAAAKAPAPRGAVVPLCAVDRVPVS